MPQKFKQFVKKSFKRVRCPEIKNLKKLHIKMLIDRILILIFILSFHYIIL